ncbi:MAG TPA: polymer-forming cytoskeletal protein [Candidatus Saccharimonadales bacterium]|nr:polymer-forming cytoskeletal protein [Candidatus Saccharimonadales bacterium]
MKRKIAAISAVLGLFFALAGVGLAHAQTFSTVVYAGKTVDSSLYSVGKQIDIQGTVNGDVYCTGQNVLIDATVHGDILCAAQSIVISGHVDGNVRTVGVTMTLNAAVGGSASLAAQNLAINPSASIGRDLSAAGSKAVIQAPVGRDASLASKTTQISSTIGRNVVMNGSNLSLQSGAYIAGDLAYTSVDTISKNPSAKVEGKTDHRTPPVNKKGHIAVFGVISAVAFPMLLLFAMALVLLFPQTVDKVAQFPRKKLFKTVMVGILTMFVVPMVLALLIASVVGVVAGIFMLLLWLLLVLLSGPVTAYYIGSMLLAKSKNPLAIMLVGALVLLVVYLLPQIGVIAGVFSYVIGIGAILQYAKAHFKKPVYKV